MPKTFVIGDIHGAYRALLQCLDRSGFDYETDHLISLGDVCDGWPETKACIDELLKIKRLTYIFGNHDFWTLEWMNTDVADEIWLKQGGMATIKSYEVDVPENHIAFLEKALNYYILDNKLFVHAGIDPLRPLREQDTNIFLWDRNLALTALDLLTREVYEKLTEFDEVYLGHTPVPYPNPVKASEIWLMDTGAGWSGVLSMMDINTKEVYVSDPVPSLYAGVEGRKKVIR